ncbi:MAG: cyclic nucleotide-binding domain-containing protein [Myxococcota bacterium]
MSDSNPFSRNRLGQSSQDQGPERRVSPRVAARFPVKIFCMGLSTSLEARSSDVGPTGVGVETPTPFALDSIRRVVIELPDGPLQAKAVGRWQKENAAVDAHLSGIQLIDLEPEASSRLWRFVHQRAGELAAFLHDHTDLELEMDEALDLALFTRVVEFQTGCHIYQQDEQGTRGDSVYLVRSGRVLLEARYKSSQPLVLDRVEGGGLFGGLPSVAGVPHVTSAVTECEVLALEIDAHTFEQFATSKPAVAQRIAKALMRRQAFQMRTLVETAIRLRQEG